MPSPQEILNVLTSMAHDWQWLAIVWHGYVAALGVSLAFGWRPPRRVMGMLLLAPVASMAVLAGLAGNPFTAGVVGVFVIGALVVALRSMPGKVMIAAPLFAVVGIALVVFGLIYPHFLEPASFVTYAWSAPVGIVPCPTLAVAIGFSILLGGLSRRWSWLLGMLGLFYGAYGAVVLAINMDWALAGGALVLILFSSVRQWQKAGS